MTTKSAINLAKLIKMLFFWCFSCIKINHITVIISFQSKTSNLNPITVLPANQNNETSVDSHDEVQNVLKQDYINLKEISREFISIILDQFRNGKHMHRGINEPIRGIKEQFN